MRFTSSININSYCDYLRQNISNKIKIKNTISTSYGAVYSRNGDSLGEFHLFDLTLNIPKSSSVIASVSFNGYADDYVKVYLNNNLLNSSWGANIPHNSCKKDGDYCWYPCYSFSSDITNKYITGSNAFKFNILADGWFRGINLTSTSVSITYITY